MGPARREHTRDVFERGARHARGPPPREEAVGRRVPERGAGGAGSSALTLGPRVRVLEAPGQPGPGAVVWGLREGPGAGS